MSTYLVNNNIYYGSRTVLATTIPTFGSDVFSNIHNNEDFQNNPYKLNNNNSYLNYLNTYNWTNDLPTNANAKITFVSMLSNFISHNDGCELLEVGAFAGTSVIGMLQYLPNANATAIDNWDSYKVTNDSQDNGAGMVERVFFDNISNAGLRSRITAFKGDIATVLTYLRQQNKQVGRQTKKLRGGKKSNGHKATCQCPICKNMRGSRMSRRNKSRSNKRD